jgi:hypothetical protein
MEFKLDDFKMFINTLWYDNVDDCNFLGSRMFFHRIFTCVKWFFNHLTKIK